MDSLIINEEIEKFLTITAMLKVLMHGFDGPQTMDRNDLYELAYIENSIKSFLNKGIQVNTIRENAHSILYCVQLIIQSLTKDNINDIFRNKVKKHIKYNTLKYGKKQAYPQLTTLQVTQYNRYTSIIQIDTIDKTRIAEVLLRNTGHWINKMKNSEVYDRYNILADFDAQLTQIEQDIKSEDPVTAIRALASAEELYILNKYDIEAHITNIRLYNILDKESFL